ncbi:substrate-binding periplasmic protein [Vibrio marisflavi]|uniref:Solute-binding protein family 3/N-terminal domain-containing protein n=1 Tax=Vibrio marisflavi CECT 7928 TaxID=634439 RepID=A0ABM9A0Q9_9VIBR|nr:transporter substrate-binding domain-containing protein [Vibrio marisflavi]CAH0537086.1 hypothetical protein VMF7928_00922 [Vibrio marisflavi CECT 7928]
MRIVNYNILFLLILILMPYSGYSREITLSGIEDTIDGEISAKVLEHAYSIDDINLNVLYMPAQRSIATSSAGKVDGELFRTPDSVSKYSSLIQVAQPIHYVNVYIATKSKSGIESIEQLRNRSIGVVRGRLYKRLTQGFDNVSMVTRHNQLVKMLINDRVDAIILSEYTLRYYMSKENKENTKNIVVLGDPIYSSPVFHYLHKRNKDLVPIIKSRVNQVMDNGIYEKILSKYTLLSGGK